MKLKVIVHNAEEGGFWAEVPSIPGCHTQGETWDELLQNIYEAIEACLSVDLEGIELKPEDRIRIQEPNLAQTSPGKQMERY